MTGVPILDTVIYITWGAMLLGTMTYSILKIFGKNGQSKTDQDFGRRSGDLAEVKSKTDDHEKRIAQVEGDMKASKQRDESMQRELSEFKKQSEQFRQEQRENTIEVHKKLDRLIERGS